SEGCRVVTGQRAVSKRQKAASGRAQPALARSRCPDTEACGRVNTDLSRRERGDCTAKGAPRFAGRGGEGSRRRRRVMERDPSPSLLRREPSSQGRGMGSAPKGRRGFLL